MAFHDCASVAIRHRRSVAASNLRTCKRSRLVPGRSACVATEHVTMPRATKASFHSILIRTLIHRRTSAAILPQTPRTPSSRRTARQFRSTRSPTPATRRGSACHPPGRSRNNAISCNRWRNAHKAPRHIVSVEQISKNKAPAVARRGPIQYSFRFRSARRQDNYCPA